MDIIEFREYCLGLGEVEERIPFGKFNAKYDSILAFYVCGHMFCFIDIEDFTYVDLKAAPEVIEELRMTKSSVGNPINQSLKHWIKIDLGGDVSESQILDLVKVGYRIVKEKYTPKPRRKIQK